MKGLTILLETFLAETSSLRFAFRPGWPPYAEARSPDVRVSRSAIAAVARPKMACTIPVRSRRQGSELGPEVSLQLVEERVGFFENNLQGGGDRR